LNNRNNDVIDVEPRGSSSQRAESLVAIGWVSYILHLIVAVAAVVPSAQPSILLLLVALVIDLVKRSDAEGTWQESHFSWRICSVGWAGVLYGLTSPLWLLFVVPGWIAWGLISLWFLYRIIRGMLAMSKGRGVDA